MGKLRIVHTEASAGWGGQEIRILSESRGLMDRGHSLHLLCAPESRIAAEAARWEVPVTVLPIGRKRLRGLRAMLDWFRANPCDVVSTHSSTDSWLAALAMRRLGRPAAIVRTRHISAPVPTNAPTRWLYGRAASRVVTTGEALRRELVERNGLPPGHVVSVPTGIDPVRFSPGNRPRAREVLGLPQDRVLVGIVATLRSWKGHRFLVEAMAGMAPGIDLVIVGDGPQREALEALVERLGLRDRVSLKGNSNDVLPWLQALDVFALPSYANEGVPQALLQAMLVGLPCVTTNVGGIPELARDGDTALVVAPEQVAPLRQAIERLAADPALRARLGAAARRHCEAGYSYQAMLDRMEAIYLEASRR